MPLLDWVSRPVATATLATSATHSPQIAPVVANVADVAVANPQVRNYTSPETKWPEFAAALQSGALVLCLRCVHYAGPELDALGHCAAYDTEAAPDAPFWCPSFRRVRP